MRAVAITISDRCARGEQADVSGTTLVECLGAAGVEIAEKIVVSDDLDELIETLKHYLARQEINLIVTTGGTGIAPRDNTPEATRAVIEKELPGLAEAMRAASLAKTPTAMLSRGVCGASGQTLIVNLPGSPKAVRECFAVIAPVLQHAIDLLDGNTQH